MMTRNLKVKSKLKSKLKSDIEVKERVDYKGQPILDTDGQLQGYIDALKTKVDKAIADPSKHESMGTISVMPQNDKIKYVRYCFSLIKKFLNVSPDKLSKLWLYLELRLKGVPPKEIARMANVPTTRANEQEIELVGLIQEAITAAQNKGVPLVGSEAIRELNKPKKIVI